jgi:MFS transporter, UMF1 family
VENLSRYGSGFTEGERCPRLLHRFFPLRYPMFSSTRYGDGMAKTLPEDLPEHIPPTADTDQLPLYGLLANGEKKVPKRQSFSWALWDWATQPFATVITTFVFTVYLVSDLFVDPEILALGTDSAEYQAASAALSRDLGYAIAAAGFLIAALAPVLGQRSDRASNRKWWLGINTILIVFVQAGLFFVTVEPNMFVLGITLVAAGNVFAEIANVHYNAMLVQVSTVKTVGRISGLGWGFGYLGGIVMLLIAFFGFLQYDLFGLGDDNGIAIRAIAVACAVWTIIFAIPIFLFVPEAPKKPATPQPRFFASYVELFREVVALRRHTPTTFWFLLSSAIFRDGLSGVFTFGGVLAAGTFGFSFNEVVIFGIAANLVAGVSTMIAGRLDDWVGPRIVILTSLGGLVAVGVFLFLVRDMGANAFWLGGMLLATLVGPAQASARSFLARVSPVGQEGQIFGLYATTGRAVSFLTPTLWAVAIGIGGAQYWGILGIVFVLLLGFIFMAMVKLPEHVRQKGK